MIRGDSPFHQGQERRVNTVGNLKLVGVLPKEQDTLVNKLYYNQPQDLAQVSSRNKFLI